MSVHEIQTMVDLLTAVAQRRKEVNRIREQLVPASTQVAGLIRNAYAFAGHGEYADGAATRARADVQQIDMALRTIDLYLSNLAAKARQAATAVEESEKRREHSVRAMKI